MDTHDNAFGGSHSVLKKRVLFVITQSEFGGAQQFVYQFLKNAPRDAYDFDVAVGGDGDGSFTRAVIALGIPVFTIPRLRRNIHPMADLMAIRDISRLITKLKPDTLFLNSSKAGFVGALAARGRRDLNVIYRIGGWSFNDPGPKWRKWLWQKMEKISAPWKDWIIVNNSVDLSLAKEYGIRPRNDVVMIHNGIDPYKVELLPRDRARSELLGMIPGPADASDQPKTMIGCLANFYPAKGLEYLIEAVGDSRLSTLDFKLLIIGDGPERRRLEELIKVTGLEHKVFLIGRLARASQFLQAFDIFILPSIKEGLPWSVLEAMSAKLPIIATRVGAVPEIIEDGVSGHIVEPENPVEIVEKILIILGSESKSREMGIQAHQRVLFSFSIDAMVSQIEKLL